MGHDQCERRADSLTGGFPSLSHCFTFSVNRALTHSLRAGHCEGNDHSCATLAHVVRLQTFSCRWDAGQSVYLVGLVSCFPAHLTHVLPQACSIVSLAVGNVHVWWAGLLRAGSDQHESIQLVDSLPSVCLTMSTSASFRLACIYFFPPSCEKSNCTYTSSLIVLASTTVARRRLAWSTSNAAHRCSWIPP